MLHGTLTLLSSFNEGIRWSCLDVKSRTTQTADALKKMDVVAAKHEMPHPRQSAEEELSAAMLAVSGYDPERQPMSQSVSVPDAQALITISDDSDNEEIVFE
jgi:hypothetical protein